jgi:TPR repeat protein
MWALTNRTSLYPLMALPFLWMAISTPAFSLSNVEDGSPHGKTGWVFAENSDQYGKSFERDNKKASRTAIILAGGHQIVPLKTGDHRKKAQTGGSAMAADGSKAADGHNVEKKKNLQTFKDVGKIYKAKQYRKAFAGYLVLASDKDFPQAQFNLAVMLKLGQGALQDYAEAYKWCVLAELNGLKKATKYLETLTDLLTEKRLEALHKDIAKLLEEKIYKGSRKHIQQLATWLLREPFDTDKNRDLALVWAIVGSALEIPGSVKIKTKLIEDRNPEQLEKIQKNAKKIFLEPKFQKVFGSS